MIHLTLTGYYAGSPICCVSKTSARANGDSFTHAVYADLTQPDLCPTCLAEWSAAGEVDDHAVPFLNGCADDEPDAPAPVADDNAAPIQLTLTVQRKNDRYAVIINGTLTCDYLEPTAAWANVETQAILMAALTGGRARYTIFTDDQGDPHARWQVQPV